jgi:hypothetical protein
VNVPDRKQHFIDAFVAARMAAMYELIQPPALAVNDANWLTPHCRETFTDEHCAKATTAAANAWYAYATFLGLIRPDGAEL